MVGAVVLPTVGVVNGMTEIVVRPLSHPPTHPPTYILSCEAEQDVGAAYSTHLPTSS